MSIKILQNFSVIGLFLLSSMTIRADIVPLGLSNGFNYDGYITAAEADHAALYDPPENWGFINREVANVFNDHFLSLWRLSYSWDDQGFSGLPANGQITTGYGDFQLSTRRDAEPINGYVFRPPEEFTSLPTAPNVMRAYRPHSRDQNHPTASVSATLPVAQQVKYDSANFLISGSEHKVFIYADYDDGNGGIDQQLIFEAPGAPKTAEETGFPEPKSDVSKNADVVSALRMDHLWKKYSNRSSVRPGVANIWTFAQPLPLDSTLTLRGFTLAIYNQDNWRARRAFIYAASANRVAEPTLSTAAKSSAIAEDGTSVIATHNTLLKKIDAQGNELWSQSLGLIAGEPLIGSDNDVYAGSSNAHVYGLSDAGVVLWSTSTLGAVAGLTFNNDQSELIAVTTNGWLYALGLNGDVLWNIDIGLPAGTKVNVAPAVSPPGAPTDHIYIKDNQGRLYAIEPALPIQNREASVQWVR